jgi:hypothetical protein
MENGLNNLGLLSTLYLTKKEQVFFAGLFDKNHLIYLVVKVKAHTFITSKVTNNNIEDLLRGKIRLSNLIQDSFKVENIISCTDGTPLKLTWTLYVFLMEAANRIYTIPNAYYYWNEFQYALKR